jgi:hypothetical protein
MSPAGIVESACRGRHLLLLGGWLTPRNMSRIAPRKASASAESQRSLKLHFENVVESAHSAYPARMALLISGPAGVGGLHGSQPQPAASRNASTCFLS